MNLSQANIVQVSGKLPHTAFLRFSPLIREGLRFKKRFEQAKLAASDEFPWYPYDCFASLFPIQALLAQCKLSFRQLISAQQVLDLGCADGALSFFAESLGAQVDAVDHSCTNINQMRGVRWLARQLRSQVNVLDRDVDALATPVTGQYGLTLFLGTLYHLKNPFACLESLSSHSRMCLLSTRIMQRLPGLPAPVASLPVAYLLDAGEAGGDVTNYWIFSEAGIARLIDRSGWTLLAWLTTGSEEAEPAASARDGRLFALLRSKA